MPAGNEVAGALTLPVAGGGEAALDRAIFGAPVHEGLHYDAVRQFMAKRRAGTHATRNRARVRGGGRKPWRQKGTGRARTGSRRNPLWRGGGTIFGPRPRDYGYRLPGRMQRGALRSALSLRTSEGRVRLFENLGLEGPSTRTLVRQLAEWSGSAGRQERGRVLIVEERPSEELRLSARNLQAVEVVSVRALHCYHILKAGTIFFRRSSLEALSRKLRERGARP